MWRRILDRLQTGKRYEWQAALMSRADEARQLAAEETGPGRALYYAGIIQGLKFAWSVLAGYPLPLSQMAYPREERPR